MNLLPNSHAVLGRQMTFFDHPFALVGVTDASINDVIGKPGIAVSEQYDVYLNLAKAKGWVAAFGYVSPPTLPESGLSTVVVFVPKARAEFAMRLDLARSLLKKGGDLLVVGEKKEGIAGAARQLSELFPGASKIDSAKHCQVWHCKIAEQAQPFNIEQWLRWHSLEIANQSTEIAGLPGVFSDGELDEGTRTLLETCAENPLKASKVLDFGCGAGVLGVGLTRIASELSLKPPMIDGVDVQAQAVWCAQRTYERNEVAGTIHPSDGLAEVSESYDAIVSNPPFHRGVQKDTSMTERFIQAASKHVRPGGELRLVANRFLPYADLLKKSFDRVNLMAETGRFAVWSAHRD